MARIAGVDVPQQKKISVALTSVFGIGMFSASQILKTANVDVDKKTADLAANEVSSINSIIEKDYMVEGELRQQVFGAIKRLKDIRCYRGIRHKVGLPVRGQRTRTNAVTRKGKNIAVGGLKRTLEKT